MTGATADDRDGVDPSTIEAEEAEARRAHTADRPPTEAEAERADDQPADPSVAEHFEEMNRIGADVKGEGEIS
jgi:hypothetical protein